MAGFAPTEEQELARTLFASGGSLAIKAGAGAGKTSTLRLLAEDNPNMRGAFTAFNSAIVKDAAGKMPRNVRARTAHGFAFAEVGREFSHRLNSPRLKSMDVARILRLDAIHVGQKRLSPGYLAGYVMRALTDFCQSGDLTPMERHFPYIEGIDYPHPQTGARTYTQNMKVRRACLPALNGAWKDACDPAGKLRYTHANYLKLWSLQDPWIGAQFLMIDECQDLSGVMISIVQDQQKRGSRIVLVGDSAQAINTWMGAVDAFEHVPTDHSASLTRSFRFGPEIAAVANDLLDQIGAELRLEGNPDRRGLVGRIDGPDAVLTRTNATAVETVMDAQRVGIGAYLVGGGKEVAAFARGSLELRGPKGWTSHPDLTCFDSWGEVQDYVSQDEQGGELRLLVDLVDTYGAEEIIQALDAQTSPASAELTVSTVHKSKGLEWPRVRLAADFRAPDKLDTPELRLLYVAVTRAKDALDITDCPSFEPAPVTAESLLAGAL